MQALERDACEHCTIINSTLLEDCATHERLLRGRQLEEQARNTDHARRMGKRFASSFEIALVFLGVLTVAGAAQPLGLRFDHQSIPSAFWLVGLLAVLNSGLIGTMGPLHERSQDERARN